MVGHGTTDRETTQEHLNDFLDEVHELFGFRRCLWLLCLLLFLMTTRISAVDGVTVAVGVGLLIKLRVPRQEHPELRVVVPRTHLHQRRRVRRPVPVRAVARRGVVAIRAGRRTRTPHRLPEALRHRRGRHRPAPVRGLPRRPPAIRQRVLPVATDQPDPPGVRRRDRRTLPFQDELAPVEPVARHRPVHRPAHLPPQGVVPERRRVPRLRDARELPVEVVPELRGVPREARRA